jgi:hypothetical protein
MDDASQTRTAVAALFASLVKALDEATPGIARSFVGHLGDAQARCKEDAEGNRGAIDLLSRTQALLREDFDRTEPAYLVYPKRLANTDDLLPSTDKIVLPTLDDAIRFWSRLPPFDRERATIETASGHRLDAAAVATMAKRLKERAAAP